MENANLITKLRSTARYVALPARELLIAAAEELERLGAELADERYRHDRYVDFEPAQSRELARLREERRWISPDERMPEAFRPVLVCQEKEPGKRIVAQGYTDLGGWWKVYGTRVKKVDGWMPLPEPPQKWRK